MLCISLYIIKVSGLGFKVPGLPDLPSCVNRGVLHTHLQNNLDLLVSWGVKCMSYLLTGISPTERSNWKPGSQLSPEDAQCPHMETPNTGMRAC